MAQYESLGYITIAWTNAVKDGSWLAWRVYRRTIGGDVFFPTTPSPWELIYETTTDQPAYEYHDWAAPVGLQVQWAVVQVAERFGSEVESNYPASNPIIPAAYDYWLIDPADETRNLKLHVNADRFLPEREEESILIIGRGRHIERGTDAGVQGTLQAKIRRDNLLTPTQQRQRLEQLQLQPTVFKLRTPFGQVWDVALANIPMTRIPGVGSEELIDIEITYSEVK
jgi:hypothetical protein